MSRNKEESIHFIAGIMAERIKPKNYVKYNISR